ncbi:Zinc finger, RING/FYVE/PHD-type [Cynara cardunculus var. scolymus]|uniref:RING-type E3 ubiquitin transferase n=1 Tax=Cynara cardunculus var. scolymus TaxID=59895 RepID=A0A103Y8I7_CYNCS|nr:Zinc finger, RING/FYVE/PHD-type [Cynara cardunculus var. scolymus]
MLQGNLLMGGRLDHDRYRDWRLDVDSMSYEELLELGDKIGYVSTGLREDEIGQCVRKTKPPHVPTQMQWKCTICQSNCLKTPCSSEKIGEETIKTYADDGQKGNFMVGYVLQEEYEGEDEIGKLECGHFYHMYCIKQWLVQKKTCPICKVVVESQN